MTFVGIDIMDTKDTFLRLTWVRLTEMDYGLARLLVDRLTPSDPRYREAQLWLNGFWKRALDVMVIRAGRLTAAAESPTTPTSGST